MRKLFVLFILPLVVYPQDNAETKMENAFQNAKKGIYYALSNIPDRKNSINKELIDNDKLISKVKLNREVKGVAVESEGYFETYEVKVTMYRSYESLMKDGIIKYIPDDDE